MTHPTPDPPTEPGVQEYRGYRIERTWVGKTVPRPDEWTFDHPDGRTCEAPNCYGPTLAAVRERIDEMEDES